MSSDTQAVAPVKRYIDRSRIVADWDCPRKRFWAYEYGGKGISPATTSIELWVGTTLHDALAAIARQELEVRAGTRPAIDIDLIATESARQMFDALAEPLPGELPSQDILDYANEQACLIEGIIRGFYRHAWPRLIALYPNIKAVEVEVVKALSEHLDFMSKPDLVLAGDGGVYIELKSTSTKKEDWINCWVTAVQLHSGCKAVEETLGFPVEQVIVQGLYKGYESYGKQNSPFCYAYVRPGNPPFTRDSVRYDYAAGYKRQPVWLMDGGIKAWVENMPDDLLAEQFPQTPPIFVNEDLVEAFFRQTRIRESHIARAMHALEHADHDDVVEDILDQHFPQHFDRCNPGWGRGCSYKALCHGRVDDPLSAGFTWRTPHHDPEIKAFEAAQA